MTRLAIGSFRVKVSKLGIKGTKQGVKVYFTHKQIEDVFNGVAAKTLEKHSQEDNEEVKGPEVAN